MKVNTLKNLLKRILHYFAIAVFVTQNTLVSAVTPTEIKTINLNPNFGFPLQLSEDAATIAIGDPNLIDIVTVKPNMLMITGQVVGATSLTVFGKSGAIYQYRVQISADVAQLRNLIQSIEPRVTVADVNGKILLTGEVETPSALTRVLTLADRFAGGNGQPDFKVVSDYGGVLAGNLDESQSTLDPAQFTPLNLGGGGGQGGGQGGGGQGGRGGLPNNRILDEKANLAQNISRANIISVANGKVLSMIKVNTQPKIEIQMRIVEIDRSKTDAFGIDWRLDGSKVTIGSKTGKVVNTLPSPSSSTNGQGAIDIGSSNLIGFFTPGNYFLSTFVNILETKGAVSTLSEPLLTAISGESARFLVGGSVPILSQVLSAGNATQNAQTATNVVFIQFGLQITVRPTVLENGKISIVLDQSISEPDYANAIQAIGATVPGFKQKAVSTVTESDSGETWAVAGLLTEEDRKSLESVPWISKVPILGKIFETKDDSTSRNELIILVNARRVDTPNSTTTNFSSKGKLAPSASPDNNAETPATDSPNNEMSSNHLPLPTKKVEPATSSDIEQQPININKKLKDKNNLSTPNSKSKKIAVSQNKSALDLSSTEEPAIKIINLKEKNTVAVDDVALEKKVVGKALQQDDVQVFSFDTEKIIKDIIEKKSNAHVANTQPVSDSKTAPQHEKNLVAPPNTQSVNIAENSDNIKQNSLNQEKPQPKVIQLAEASSTTSKNQESNKNSPPISTSTDFVDNKALKSDENLVNQPQKSLGKDLQPQQDILALSPVEEKKTSPIPDKETIKQHFQLENAKQINVVVINFLSSEDKYAYFNHALKSGLMNVPPKSEWAKWKVAMGAVNGNAKKLIKFAVSPQMRKQIFSGTSASIQVPKNYFNYAVD